jgi:hypothetical protein
MAEVRTPSVPPRLYRYRSITRDDSALEEEIEAITQRYIWCSDFTKLNDPMEGSYNPSTVLRGKPNYAGIIKKIVQQKVDIGIASFSEVKHSELMWTHYTSNHAGICVSYSSHALLKCLPDSASMVRVGYAESPPRLSSREAKDEVLAAAKIFSQKKVGWQYEREWRVLANKGKVSCKNEECVRAVYLGTRINPTQKKKLIHAFTPLGIPLYAMEVQDYEHKATRLLTGSRS